MRNNDDVDESSKKTLAFSSARGVNGRRSRREVRNGAALPGPRGEKTPASRDKRKCHRSRVTCGLLCIANHGRSRELNAASLIVRSHVLVRTREEAGEGSYTSSKHTHKL
jgi:hypothetical protein